MSAKENQTAPPRWAHALLERYCLRALYEEVSGDIEEQYHLRLERWPAPVAGVLYWLDVLSFYRVFTLQSDHPSTLAPIMWRNYLKVALRSMRRHAGYTFINVGGLVLGLTCGLLILLFVRYELSFDRFQEHADDLYRITRRSENSAGEKVASVAQPWAFAPALEADFGEVIHAVRLDRLDDVLFQRPDADGETAYEDGFVFADSSIFDVFTLPMRRGDPSRALSRPYTLVLTETLARKYFGDADPVGRTLQVQNDYTFEVTGVVADPPDNSSIQFSALASMASFPTYRNGAMMVETERMAWGAALFAVYVRLVPGADAGGVAAKLGAFASSHSGATYLRTADYHLEPLTDEHLFSDMPGSLRPASDARYVYIFGTVALLILLLASVNYMNLATARALRRAHEVGVRKVVGARRGQLALQFLGEAVLSCLLAMVVALVLVRLFLPVLNQVVDRHITLDVAADQRVICLMVLVAMGVGVVSGSYPAFVLSRFRPSQVLMGGGSDPRRGRLLRRGLVTFQFAVSAALVVGVVAIQQQLDFVRSERLGLDAEHVVVVPLGSSPLRKDVAPFREAVRQLPAFRAATASTPIPTRHDFGMKISTRTTDALMAHCYWADGAFFETMGIPVITGRGLLPSDAKTGVVVNEALVRDQGWTHPLDERISLFDNEYQVVGVVSDFHDASLHEAIQPGVFFFASSDLWYVSARVRTQDLNAAVTALRDQWHHFAPDHPFEYFFLDDAYQQLYEAEDRLGKIFGAFTVVALAIACLGLFGLAAYSAEGRRKEVGVRKVLGASVRSLVLLLSREFVVLVAVAFAVAAPLAALAVGRWLDTFAYRINVSWQLFALSGALALAVTILSVGYQAVRAAIADPVKVLRYEG